MTLTRRLASLLFAAAPLALAAAPSRAVPPASLVWKAPAGCPSRDDVLDEARRLLGGDLRTATPLDARAEVVLAAPSDYRMRIVLDPGPGVRPREVHAPTCAEVADAAALILALAIDPAAVASAPEGSALRADRAAPPPPPPPGSPPDAASGAPAPPSVAPPGPDRAPPLAAPAVPAPVFAPPVFSLPEAPLPPPAPPRVLRAHASLAAEAGTFRDPSPMIRAGVSFAPEPLRFEAGLVLAWGGSIPVLSAPEKGAELWLAAGALSACRALLLDRAGPRAITVAACAGVEGGAIVASSHGVSEPATALSPWAAPVAGGLFRWTIARRVALRLDLQLAIPLVHPTFRIEGLGVVHAPGPVTARAGAGVEIDLSSR